MEQLYTFTVFTENRVGLLNQISIIFTRRSVNIESLSVSPSSIPGIHKFTITANCDTDMAQKIVMQIEKRIDVLKAFVYTDADLVYQEIALYKVPTDKLVAERATIIEYLLSDAAQIEVWPRLKKHLTAGKALYFSHGFAITYKERTGIVPPADVDVIMVAPKGSGTSLRRLFVQGRGINSSFAVFQDATGRAKERCLALGIGIGSGYMFETDFKREVYSDLTGERGTLMGAIQGIFAAQYDTLRAHGHTPSEAFNESIEELTQSLMPLISENGMDWMYANCSTTAQRGALDWWKKFRDATRPVFENLYNEVESGNEAQRSIDSNSKPGYREGLQKELQELHDSEMWRTGDVVRKLRPEND